MNIFLIIVTIILYILNQRYKASIKNEQLYLFMNCYFNDLIGGITFIAYCNFVGKFFRREISRLPHILALLFFCGLFWEYITPLFRRNIVADVFDILAYMVGGIIYWGISRLYKRKREAMQ